MIDDLLFQRGHIFIRIGDKRDDFDSLIAEHYFKNYLEFEGEIMDSSGSEYNLIALDGDGFEIEFTVGGVQFETDDDRLIEFAELIVRCTGVIAPEVIWEDPLDVLQIATYDVLRVI